MMLALMEKLLKNLFSFPMKRLASRLLVVLVVLATWLGTITPSLAMTNQLFPNISASSSSVLDITSEQLVSKSTSLLAFVKDTNQFDQEFEVAWKGRNDLFQICQQESDMSDSSTCWGLLADFIEEKKETIRQGCTKPGTNVKLCLDFIRESQGFTLKDLELWAKEARQNRTIAKLSTYQPE